MLVVFLVMTLLRTTSSAVFSYQVPYEYLATRTPLNTGFPMSTPFSPDMMAQFSSCSTSTCYSAVFNKEGSESQFQLLLDKQNNWTTFPNVLVFTKEEYNYSIVFSNNNALGNVDRCMDKSVRDNIINKNFAMPKCQENFQFNFTRANGRTWCWMIDLISDMSFDAASAKCQESRAELNGFQSSYERDAFTDSLMKMQSCPDNFYLLLGAKRSVECHSNSTCAVDNLMNWIGNVSTNISLANDITSNWDGSGACLSLYYDITSKTVNNDDMSCDSPHSYSCGKYADVYAENSQNWGWG